MTTLTQSSDMTEQILIQVAFGLGISARDVTVDDVREYGRGYYRYGLALAEVWMLLEDPDGLRRRDAFLAQASGIPSLGYQRATLVLDLAEAGMVRQMIDPRLRHRYHQVSNALVLAAFPRLDRRAAALRDQFLEAGLPHNQNGRKTLLDNLDRLGLRARYQAKHRTFDLCPLSQKRAWRWAAPAKRRIENTAKLG